MAAIDIFALVPECESLFAPMIRVRHKIVLKHMGENYTLRGGNAKNRVMEELARDGHAIGRDTVSGYARVYHLAYLYYHGEKIEEINTWIAQDNVYTRPLAIMLRNGVTRWEQIVALEEARKAREPDMVIGEVLEEHHATEAATVRSEENEHPDEVMKALHTVFSAYSRMRSEAETLHEQIELALQEITELREEVWKLRASLIAKDREIGRYVAAQPSTDIKILDEMALRYPTLFNRFAGLSEAIREEGRRRNAIPQELPTKAVWMGDPGNTQAPREVDIRYAESYLTFYKGTQENIRTQMVKQLNLLCAQGPSYSSFDTKPIAPGQFHNSPEGARYSKINNEGHRFTWTFNPRENVLTLHDAGIEENVIKVQRTYRRH